MVSYPYPNDDMTPRYSAAQWQFVRRSDKWVWRQLLADGTVDSMSALSFQDYAIAVNDALRHGFSPSRNHWSIVSDFGVTHFEVGQPPVFIPMRDADPSSPVPAAGEYAPNSKPSQKEADAEQ